jgi:predicted PurR-regulated permease PerM
MEKSLMRFVYFLVAGASVFIIVHGIQSSAYVINSILLAAMITIGVLPVTRGLIERGWRPSLSLILTLLLVVAVIGLVLFLMYASLSGLTTEPATPAPVGEAGDGQGQPETLFGRVQELVSGGDASQVLADVAGWVGQVLSQSITVLMIFMFMLSASAVTPISDQLEKVGGNPTLDVVSDLTADVQQYLSITTLVNFTVGLVDAIFLWAMGIENAILWGIMAWIFGYIPVVGF